MTEIKVRLSMCVPGAQMLSSRDCEKMSKKDAYNYTTVVVEHKGKKGKSVKKDILHVYTRKSKPARQNLSISKEGYSSMVDAKIIPAPSVTKTWNNMTAIQRLEWHLRLIAENFNALSFSYEILDD